MPTRRLQGWVRLILISLAAGALAPGSAAAEKIKVGLQKSAGSGPLYIAQEKGYFTAEGLSAELVFFEAPVPIAVAAASGDIDFGVSGLSSALYNLAGQGVLRIIAGSLREAPTFKTGTLVASPGAYQSGLRSYKDLAGRSAAITSVAGPAHYNFALLAAKYDFDLGSMRLLQFPSSSAAVAAVIGGQADATMLPLTFLRPALERGDVKLIGFAGDVTPWQIAGVWTQARTADERGDVIARFLRVYRRGARDYHDAFTDADEGRRDGPTAPEILAVLAKYTGQPVALLTLGISYLDADARLDVKDVLHQIAWYKSQSMLKGEIDGDTVIDKRFVVPLP